MSKPQKIWNSPIVRFTLKASIYIASAFIELLASVFRRITPGRFWGRKFRKWEW